VHSLYFVGLTVASYAPAPAAASLALIAAALAAAPAAAPASSPAAAPASSPAAAPASAPAAAASAPASTRTGIGAFQVKQKKDESVAERALVSRKETQEVMRNSKRDQKINNIRNGFSPPQTQSSLQAASKVVVHEGKTVVDAQGNPVTEACLQEKIEQYAKDHNITPQEAVNKLNSITNVHDFAKSFIGLLQNRSEAWRNQEQEVTFSTVNEQQGTEETVNGWGEDEDEDMFAGYD